MAISVFDLFSIGIGPSSSHTVGPMRAARMFARRLRNEELLDSVASVRVELYGSLGATGHGHGTPKAVLLGLEGDSPRTVDVESADDRVETIKSSGRISLLGDHEIAFAYDDDMVLHRRKALPYHANGMTLWAYDAEGAEVLTKTYYSVGGGFVVDEDAVGADRIVLDDTVLKYPFRTGDELLRLARETGLSISALMLENERAWRDEDEIREGLLEIWRVMRACVDRGMTREGILPGGLKVRRRAANTARKLRSEGDPQALAMEWITLYAMAVNEENAAGGRVVTAPTNGAAGIIPAVLHYYMNFVPGADEDGVVRFLLAAGAIGMLFKENASISGAEVGCQGEVGSACSMAAGALAEVLGGSPEQVENAAEIGMEHNLGLTCDPVGGLVQIPCIERNGMAAVKAVTAARMAMRGDGSHKVSLDKVIKTMKETGADMSVKYKETARGGLAVNIIEC
ncbi:MULTISPECIES: L-serine ammonia-lyase [Streptomyces]|uniref:L-serine dehydratase n=2 Tax=Streptomyces TaxID=1883 RepID=SDHL_STRCO|nr:MULTISPECIES: L-serine ammonia-lyase [Streptomyces]O86564.1 RecName: Full=L-serine dehydratase; Short=SDH; AltName: Full=L-serine deaminase; Short=L-SD [Streptomyces coelicolor A3(2)]MYU44989.1 L-serine dehydratase [Streptomyces sp. SID7813]MDX2928559.1 L-serine ammonia-lyase [Streptomyces sp. NRRL_B-16638]MDX3409016.1 L-serine ammonia-lyase [Streptomyces sp. ME02-6977A]NSL83359.1 L-serine ammonia-lyase [Streptomyces coelicolor]QFI45339.1 L-serine dehydratase [Streptomyces coelicolor A3(2)